LLPQRMLVPTIAVCGVRCVCSFFFSSRRRHTRSARDWSSDVCSSDLPPGDRAASLRDRLVAIERTLDRQEVHAYKGDDFDVLARSEERRVGKESKARGPEEHTTQTLKSTLRAVREIRVDRVYDTACED